MRTVSDVAAFSEFAEACTPSLFRTAYLMAGDHQLAQDLLQEALVKTLIAWPRLHDRADLQAYTRRVIVTTSISWRLRVPGGGSSYSVRSGWFAPPPRRGRGISSGSSTSSCSPRRDKQQDDQSCSACSAVIASCMLSVRWADSTCRFSIIRPL